MWQEEFGAHVMFYVLIGRNFVSSICKFKLKPVKPTCLQSEFESWLNPALL